MQKEQVGLGDLEWSTDVELFGDQVPREALSPAEVPQLPVSQFSHGTSYKPNKYNMHHKKPRFEIPYHEDEEYFTVPDLG